MEIVEVIYINLLFNFFRRLYITYTLSKQPYPFRRIAGITYSGQTKYDRYLSNGTEDYLARKKQSRRLGVIGCWIAHATALESISVKHGITVIVEDDFVFRQDFFTHAMAMINNFNRDFDILVFDPWGDGPKEEHRIAPDIYKVEGFSYPLYYGSHCAFVNNSKLEKILGRIRVSKIRDYDSFLFEASQLDVFAFYTRLSMTKNFGSNIS